MPTPEEIKKMAVSYSVSRPADEMPTNPAMAQMIVADALKWLSKDYCIVPKNVVRKEYEKARKTYDIYTSATCINEMESRAIDHAEGRMCELTTLFGTELFNEEKG